MVVTADIVSHKASDLCYDFWGKSERANTNVIFRWLKRHALKYQIGTHVTQIPPVDLRVDGFATYLSKSK